MPPLDGLRVIDLTRVLAGPFCTMLLGDMGAEVLKIEEPELGDDSRGWAPCVDGWSSYFIGVNRNKKSVTLDLKTPQGADALRRLIGTADVLIENFRPQSLNKLGFGFDAVHAMNPRLVYCSIAGYGQTGPRRLLAGYDPVIQAEAGLMDITGFPGESPVRVGIAVTDYLAGLFALSGILLALRDRDRSGRGQHVDVALFDSLMATMALPAGIHYATGACPTRMGNQHPSIAPYETLGARDGAVMVCIGNPRLWIQFCDAIDRPELATDNRFRTNVDRLANRGELVQDIEKTLREWKVDQVLARLEAHGIPCGRVRSVAEALEDPQLVAREMVREMVLPGVGTVRVLANPMKLSRQPCEYRLPPPALGEHTAEVLRSLGYSDDQIVDMTEGAKDGVPAVGGG